MSDTPRPLSQSTPVQLGLVWGLLAAFGLGGIAYGTLASDVRHLQEGQAAVSQQGTVLVEVLRSLERLASEVSSLRRDMDEQRRVARDAR